jgi:F0F1-type ATP synthase membrane subunit b/b'
MFNIAINNLLTNLPTVIVIVICMSILSWILGRRHSNFIDNIDKIKEDVNDIKKSFASLKNEVNMTIEQYQERTEKRLNMIEKEQAKEKDNYNNCIRTIENRLTALETLSKAQSDKLDLIFNIITDNYKRRKNG